MKEILRALAIFILLVLCLIPGALAVVALAVGATALGLGFLLLWAGVFILKE